MKQREAFLVIFSCIFEVAHSGMALAALDDHLAHLPRCDGRDAWWAQETGKYCRMLKMPSKYCRISSNYKGFRRLNLCHTLKTTIWGVLQFVCDLQSNRRQVMARPGTGHVQFVLHVGLIEVPRRRLPSPGNWIWNPTRCCPLDRPHSIRSITCR